jgi:uncharacterized membrane protein
MSRHTFNQVLVGGAPKVVRRRSIPIDGLGAVGVAAGGGILATGVAVMSFLSIALGSFDEFNQSFIQPIVVPAAKWTALLGVSGLFVITVWKNFLQERR